VCVCVCYRVFSRIKQIYGFFSFFFEQWWLSGRLLVGSLCHWCPSTLLRWLQMLHSSKLNYVKRTSKNDKGLMYLAFCIQFFDTIGLVPRRSSACKTWTMICWCGYLPEVNCNWFANGPADATVTPLSLASLKYRMVYLSGASLPDPPTGSIQCSQKGRQAPAYTNLSSILNLNSTQPDVTDEGVNTSCVRINMSN